VKKLFVLVAVGLLILSAGCDTLNIGGGGPTRGPQVTLTAPTTNLFGMQTSTWTAAWSGGTGPYTIAWNFGGGATNIPAAAATSPATATSTWVDSAVAANYTVVVTVTDSQNVPGTATATVAVGPTQNLPPVIGTVAVAGGTLTVPVTDGDGDDVTVTVANFTGITPDNTTQTVTGGAGNAVFNFTADDLFAGGTSSVDITAADVPAGATDTDTANVTVPGITLTANGLHAIPLQSSVNVGDPVTVVVATGTTGSSFQFMKGAGLVMPDDATYVANSFNCGAVGGNRDDADGAWATITTNGGFLLGPDALIQPGPNPDASLPAGTVRYDFNVTPLGGSDVASAEGALFNAQFTFATAGSKTFTFQQFNGVNRSYYSDFANGTDTFWGSFVDGTVTVN
jgi:hypothetical protein